MHIVTHYIPLKSHEFCVFVGVHLVTNLFKIYEHLATK